ncbi:pheromone receptor-1 [Diaporthe helianthi]|uniref:Pheromone receptor-1 n=1 Tax=Diaporthe helianthi TaxID=158607 RepID=A0A2P5IGA1_DIAHE|nr:pheromone receptor-1 [Diaporthe helianthi]
MRLEEAIDYVGGDFGPSNVQLINIILRCILHFAAVVVCVVPMHLFCRSGELAGATLVASGAMVNLYHFCNTITWHNDDVANWPLAYGWCDIQLASTVPLETLVAASTCAILRNVSNSIISIRTTALMKSERRRKNLFYAFLIFPIPLLQVILYFFVTGQRYNISGIIGCQAVFQTNWVFLIFFILPCPIYALFAGYYAISTWWRYRRFDNESRENLWSSMSDSSAQSRSTRARRKLYFMTLTIITPWLPLQIMFLFNNIQTGWPWAAPFDLQSVHASGWNQIDYTPATAVPWAHMYGTYAYSLESLIVFLFFGLTKDAHDLYRGYLRALGLGRIFPKLNGEYFPSPQPPSGLNSVWSRANRSSAFASSPQNSHSIPSYSNNTTGIGARQFNEADDIQPLNIRLKSLDVEAARSTTEAARSFEKMPQLPSRNPWVFRTTFAPDFNMGTILGGRKGKTKSSSSGQEPLKPVIHPLHSSQAPSAMAMGKYQAGPSADDGHRASWNPAPRDTRVQTRVWVADTHSGPAADGVSLGENEMKEKGVVRVEKRISSSSEASPPEPACR